MTSLLEDILHRISVPWLQIRFLISLISIAMHIFASCLLIYAQGVIVHTAEDAGVSFSFDDQTLGSDSLFSPTNQESPSLSDFDLPEDAVWSLDEEPASETSVPLDTVKTSDPPSSLDSLFASEDSASTSEDDTVNDIPLVDDDLLSDHRCSDPSMVPVAMIQARSINPNLDICPPPQNSNPPRNIPDGLRLEDVQRIPGFVPVFHGMSDSCILYSNGILPFGVCSSTDPTDSMYSSRDRYSGWLTWELIYCTLGQFCFIRSWKPFFPPHCLVSLPRDLFSPAGGTDDFGSITKGEYLAARESIP